MAGFVGTVEGWQEFEVEASLYLKTFQIPYLHTVDLYHRQGLFKGWHSSQTRKFAIDLFRILSDHAGRGLEFSVLRNRFNERKQALVPREGSPYEFCFKGMISRLLQDEAAKELLDQPEIELSFVIENRLANMGGIQRAFNNFQIHSPKFRSLTFEDKKKFVALQVSDFLAFFARRTRVAQLRGKPFEDDLAFLEEAIAPVTYDPFLATEFYP